MLAIVDERSGCIFSGVVSKGVNPYSLHLVAEALKFLGRKKVILFTDAEHSIKALAEAVAKEYKGDVQLMTAPRESHASNGIAERGVLELAKQTRTLVRSIESKFKDKVPDFKVRNTSHGLSGMQPGCSQGILSRKTVRHLMRDCVEGSTMVRL